MHFNFITAAAKHLSSVEIDAWQSNQHEFNGVASLKQLFGLRRQYMTANFNYYSNGTIIENELVNLTWYDARENSIDRTEYRLYYTENPVVRCAEVNDLLIVGKQENNAIVVMIIHQNSPQYHLFMRLFGMSAVTPRFILRENIVA